MHAAVLPAVHPARFMDVSARLLPWAAVLAGGLLVVGLIMAFRAPPDYRQGEAVRILFLHAPAAWMALAGYGFMALAAAGAFIFRQPLAHVAVRAAAPAGACFTLLALISGSLWGKPVWGTWWVWDARLTSMAVLLLLYLGVIALWRAFDDPSRGGAVAGILAIAGSVNLPIIHYSVVWWHTLHQPASIMRLQTPAIHGAFLTPLLIMGAGFAVLFALVVLMRMRAEILRRRRRSLMRGTDGRIR